ncbi:hypothetical protein Pint_15240 [Pistacia integerrima]|uniref:Uncharacterized protein n=1 Tax=Pistacia integerrima TaxID=434235 RepID=A0ACC0ZD00_9ROSI|nr:hypothetical protein Pint_15240 [Pistacia integerrima]
MAAGFGTQANALLRKNLTFQLRLLCSDVNRVEKRNVKANIRLVAFPIVLCLLILALQIVFDKLLNNNDDNKCGCICVRKNGDECEEERCGIEHSNLNQAVFCRIPNPPEWPPLLQIPAPEYRAVRNDFMTFTDLPNESCKINGSCPAIFLLTGNNRSFGEMLGENMLPKTFSINPSNLIGSLASNVAVRVQNRSRVQVNFLILLFFRILPIYSVQSRCTSNSTISARVQLSSINITQGIRCLQGLNLWRTSSSEINDEIYKGYMKGNSEEKIHEIIAAYDFLNSDLNKFNMSIWYNSTWNSPSRLVRVPRSVNLVSNAYLRALLGPSAQILFEFVKEMPKTETQQMVDLSSIIGTLFYTWVVLQLFPVVLTALVYEKQQKLRIMMKMHGLGDGPYWMISYAYFFAISAAYMLCFVIFGSVIGLRFFTLNSYSIQFVFYFIYINLQISLAFLLAVLFSNVKTAAVVGYICIFGTGLLGFFLFQVFVQDQSFPRGWIIVMELYPGFSLYRGLYEFGQYSFRGHNMGIDGMRWADLADSGNGMREILIIMLIEWLLVLAIAYYIDKIVLSGSAKGPMFLKSVDKCLIYRPAGCSVYNSNFAHLFTVQREKVEQLLLEPSTSYAVIVDNLRKIYPGRDGNPEKLAVKGLSLAFPSGECFGMLGPNGAGKTSFIGMMIGITKPTSGAAFFQGFDIRTEMDTIYTSIGVCPQEDLLWENLTGREHLLFYGRLKNLEGSALKQAVEESLKSVNLFHGGVADQKAGKYSGGMKRRLSVAISLIGDPKVVYMDEPSTGLDPASRNNLWTVVKRAKQGRAIILTTHSMEEAEALCDRLGIFVDGSLQCIGNPKELRARYGGSYVFTMTTSADHEAEVESMIKHLSPSATKIYQISGTQKFELPKHEVWIADVFQAVEDAKRSSRFCLGFG